MPSGEVKVEEAKKRVGSKYGMLTIQKWAGSNRFRIAMYDCACDCGNTCTKTWVHLRKSENPSCGCDVYDRVSRKKTIHGHSRRESRGGVSSTYMTWEGILSRCHQPNHKNYHQYGGRGITVWSEWRESFPAFLRDVGEKPPGKTLDRIDTNGNYEPGNVRWITQQENCQNTRRNVVDAEKVREIRRLYASGVRRKTIIEMFSISESTASSIISGRTWTNI